MSRTMTIAASFAIALSTAACSDMPTWMRGDATGATGTVDANRSGYATGEAVAVPDPAGSATSGTGSVTGLGGIGREAFSSGEGLD
jgi:hypothetical protein